MVKPQISKFEMIAPIIIQKYERYLPTAFDESMSLLEKTNKVIEYLNQMGLLVEKVVDDWNEVMEWVMNDGLNEAVVNKLNLMAEDGTLASLINEIIFGELNKKIEDRTPYVALKTYENLATTIQGGKDWTQALKKALQDASLKNKALDIHVDEIIYISETIVLPDTIKMYGHGTFNTTVKTIGNIGAFDMSNANPKMGVSISGFKIEGGSHLGQIAFNLNYFTNTSKLSDLIIANFGTAIYLRKSWYSDFENIQIIECVKYGLHAYSASSTTQVNNITFKALFIRNCETNVFLQGLNVSAGITFEGCAFEKSRKTSFISDRFAPLNLENCYFEGNYTDATLTEVLTANTPIDIKVSNTTSRTPLTLVGCYFARLNSFVASTEKIGILTDENTKGTYIGCQFVCNTSSYIDVDIKSKALVNNTTIINPQQDGFAKKLYEGELKYETVAIDENINMKFTTEIDKINFEMLKGDEYFLRFYPKQSASAQPRVAWKILNSINGDVVKELLFPDSYVAGQVIELRIGTYGTNYPAVKVEGFTATNEDIFGVATIIRKFV